MRARTWSAPIALAAMLTTPLTPARAADSSCSQLDVCDVDDTAVVTGLLSRREVLALPKHPEDAGGAVDEIPATAPRYEYISLNDCPPAKPGTITEQVSCAHALRDCPKGELGPLLRIWRRTVKEGRVTEPWTTRGITCASDVAPGSRPTLTMADLKAAFMRTPWSKPQVSSQPAGNTTLVNLRTFYKVNWAVKGFQPGEVDRSVLRGIPVQIRPKLVGFTYVFGDGSTWVPHIKGRRLPQRRHHPRLPDKGVYPVRSTPPSGPISASTAPRGTRSPRPSTVPGPSTTITVREAKSVLVNH